MKMNRSAVGTTPSTKKKRPKEGLFIIHGDTTLILCNPRLALQELFIKLRLPAFHWHLPTVDEYFFHLRLRLERITITNEQGCILAFLQRTCLGSYSKDLCRNDGHGL